MNTPIYHKTNENMPWPDDKFFYILSRDGLFKCRNHEFFESCVPVKEGPPELAPQKEFLRLSYPRIPQRLMEIAVGFFQKVVDKQNSESVVIVAWNRTTQQVELLVPDQTGINSAPSHWSPRGFPQDVKYEMPKLPANLALIGDIHCHVEGSAYASHTDENDETHRPGIHIVVGKIDQEPPEFYCDAVADGKRFKVAKLELVMEGYQKRRTLEVPGDWLAKVKLQAKTYSYAPANNYHYHDSTGHGSSHGYGGNYYGEFQNSYDTSAKKDKEIMNEVLSEFSKRDECPPYLEVRTALWRRTKLATYEECERKADKFIQAWPKMKEKRNAKKAA